MTLTISAALDKKFDTRVDLTQSTDVKLVSLGEDISSMESFLKQFNKSDAELLNLVLRKVFKGISKAFENIQREVGQINDCHFSGLDKISMLEPRIKKLKDLYTIFDRAEQLQSEFDDKIILLQRLFQKHNNTHKGARAISKCFEELCPGIHAAQHSEFSIFSTFQDEMVHKNDWVTSIIEDTALFSCPTCTDNASNASTLLKFGASLFSEQPEQALSTFADFLPDFRRTFGVSHDATIADLQKILKKQILPNKIKELKNPPLFFHLLKKVASKKISIAPWDREWAKNNWEKHLSESPTHILLALCAYETRQLNQALKMTWENLLNKTSISAHDQWPTCARLLRTIKQNPSVFLVRKTGNEIYERDLHVQQIDELVEELMIRVNIHNSICAVQKRIPRCYPILPRLNEQLKMIGITLIAYPRPMTSEQKIKLENACRIFLTLVQDVQQDQYTVEDVNFLIEFITAVFLSDFYSNPSREIDLKPNLIDQITSAVHSSQFPGFYPLKTSDTELVFYPCSIQTASRIDVAAKIGRTLKLPISEMKLIDYTPSDMKKELKNMIKKWSENVCKESTNFDELIGQLEALRPPFAIQIKDFIGRCISGKEIDESQLGDDFLKKISTLPPADAKTKMKEVIVLVKNYSSSTQFKEACIGYDQSHPSLIGLAFPYFDLEQDVNKNLEQRSALPTTFKHLWFVYNLVTGNMETQDAYRLFFHDAKEDASQFRWVEISSYFSSSSGSYRGDLALNTPFARLFLETMSASQLFEEVKTHLKFKIGLASDPLDRAIERIDAIQAAFENALREDIAITPNQLISAII